MIYPLEGIEEFSPAHDSVLEWSTWLSMYADGLWSATKPPARPSTRRRTSTTSSSSLRSGPSLNSARSSGTISSQQAEEVSEAQAGYEAQANESERRKAFYRSQITSVIAGSPPKKTFARICSLVKRTFGTESVLVQLVEKDVCPVLIAVGWDHESAPRTVSLCSHTVLQPEPKPHVILDTQSDWRFAAHPFRHQIRFYAGVPLRTPDGFHIGSLCIMDPKPRDSFSEDEAAMLEDFGTMVSREIEFWTTKCLLNWRASQSLSIETLHRMMLELSPDAKSAASFQHRIAHEMGTVLHSSGAVVLDIHAHDAQSSFRARAYSDVPHLMQSSSSSSAPPPVPSTSLAIAGSYNDESMPDPFLSSSPLLSAFSASTSRFLELHPNGEVFDSLALSLFLEFGTAVPEQLFWIAVMPVYDMSREPVSLLVVYTNDEGSEYGQVQKEYLSGLGEVLVGLRAKRRLYEEDRHKATILSTLSHELRTPLNGILGSSELLSTFDLAPAEKSHLDAIHNCAVNLSETFDHVLEYAKSSRRSGPPPPMTSRTDLSEFDLAELIAEVVDEIDLAEVKPPSPISHPSTQPGTPPYPQRTDSPRLRTISSQSFRPKGHIECIVDIDPRPSGWNVVLDKIGTRRVLSNLLSNSRKHTTRGYIFVHLRVLPDSPDQLEIVVRDTGAGISASFLKEHLFQAFAQEKPTTNGVGLGLNICHEIILHQSGTIEVSSELNVGTQVSVVLPLLPTTFLQPFSPLPNPGQGRTYLLFGSSTPDLSSTPSRVQSRSVLDRHLQLLGLSPDDSRSFPPLADVIVVDEADLDDYLTTRPDSRRYILVSSDRRTLTSSARVVLHKPLGPPKIRTAVEELLSTTSTPFQGSLSRDSAAPGSSPRTGMFSPPMAVSPSPGSSPATFESSPPPPAHSISTLTVPTLSPPTPPHPESASAQSTFWPSVLIVDDSVLNRKIIARYLSKMKCPYEEAEDGQEAIDIFAARPPGFFSDILMDCSMPVKDGWIATAEIRQIEVARLAAGEGTRSRITAVTGLSSPEDRLKSEECGMDGLLVKPISLKRLWEMLLCPSS